MFKESYLLLVTLVVVFVLVEVTFVVRTRWAWEEKTATKRNIPRKSETKGVRFTLKTIRTPPKKSRGYL